MTKKTSLTILYSSIAVFVFGGFIVVMMALGYGYDFANGRIVKTGAFSITTNTTANVFINDNERGNTSFLNNSFSETRLLPGNYSVRLEATNKRPWRKNIEIKESLLTEFSSVFLLEEKITPEVIKGLANPFILTHPSQSYIRDNFLYYLSKNQLLSYDTTNGQTKTLIKKIKLFSYDEDGIIYLTTDNKLFKYDLKNSTSSPVALDVIISSSRMLHTLGNTTYVILGDDSRNNFYQLRDGELKEIAKNIDYFRISPDKNKILLYNEHEIFIYNIKKSDTQPYKEVGDLDLFTRTTKRIYDVQWFEDSQHILIDENKNLIFSEIDTRDAINRYTISENIEAFYYDESSDSAYLITSKEILKILIK